MRNQEWDPPFAQLHSLDLCQLVFRLFCGNAVDSEATFRVVDKAEVLAGLFDRDYVHEASRIGNVCANFTINFDEALHHDGFGFAGVKGILQTKVAWYGLAGFERVFCGSCSLW